MGLNRMPTTRELAAVSGLLLRAAEAGGATTLRAGEARTAELAAAMGYIAVRCEGTVATATEEGQRVLREAADKKGFRP